MATPMSVGHWEDYYRGGAIATCPMGPSSNYTLELRDLWVDFFRSLPDGARILDVGTGNGAVTLFAKEAAALAGHSFQIHGADLAIIDPVGNVPDGATLFTGVTFHPGMATEHLAFEPASFDAVTGQYALEYTRPDAALAQVFRVLRPGGRALFVLHHCDSALLRNAAESLAQGDLVLNETRIFGKLKALGAAARRSVPAARAAASELAGAAARLQDAMAGSASPHLVRVVLDAVMKLSQLRSQLSPAHFEREVDGVERDVRASLRRLRDLQASALSRERLDALACVARAAGFECDSVEEQLHAGSAIVGWKVHLQVPDRHDRGVR
jgi:SAM-dependent methyltransferase